MLLFLKLSNLLNRKLRERERERDVQRGIEFQSLVKSDACALVLVNSRVILSIF